MFTSKKIKQLGFLNLIFALVLFLVPPAQAQQETDSSDPFAKFGNYAAGSDMAIEHRVWNEFLGSVVVVMRPSSGRKASTQKAPPTGSKISRGSRSPARLESNRVLFHLLEKEHIALITKYRQELENLPNYFPLAEFDKDEQLAYWLNLHNAVLLEQLAQKYPVSKLKKLRVPKKNKSSLWDEKLVTVEGVSLSLNDIQNNILIRHWKSPMVLYGLYNGAIGGPSLPDRAFAGANVHILLKRAAEEFVNSNRGIRMRGNEARVSLVYNWGRGAFPNWETDLARHLREFAKSSLSNDLNNAAEFSPTIYDWSIADTKGGTLSAGPIISTAANLLAMGPNDTTSAVDLALVGQHAPYVSQRGGLTQMVSDMLKNGLIVPGALDAETASLLKEMARVRTRSGLADGIVTSEECGVDDCPDDLPDVEQNLEDGEDNPGGNKE